jgi:hypothetical protein
MCTENESKEDPSVTNVTNWGRWVREWLRAIRLEGHSRQEQRFSLQHRFRTGSEPRSHPTHTESGQFSPSIKWPESEFVHSHLTLVFMSWHSVRQEITLSLLSHISSVCSTTAPPTGKQTSWVSEPAWIRALITGPLPVLCCVPSICNPPRWSLRKSELKCNVWEKPMFAYIAVLKASATVKGFLMGRHLITIHSRNPVNGNLENLENEEAMTGVGSQRHKKSEVRQVCL